MNEYEAFAQRLAQLNELVPGLLRPGAERSCLYVGATPWRFQLARELHEAGYELTLLEVDKDNAYYYEGHPWLGGGVICGDVSEFVPSRCWDVIVWWHGPEHIAPGELPGTLAKLEASAEQLVVLAAPWGENWQPMVEGNSHQEHKAHLQPEDFERLGYQTATLGVQGDLSTWPHVLAWKWMQEPEPQRIVYTAIFGDYDDLRPARWPGRFVCFSDRPLQVEGWQTVVVPERRFSGPTREARMFKLLAHQWFPGVAESLWLDGNAELLVPPDELFAYLDGADIAMCRHPTSRTLADEAALIVQLGKADPHQVQRQVARYGPGLGPVGATSWLLRRHNDATRALNEMWWSELTVHTLRDQLSLPHCLKRLGLPVRMVDVDLYDNALVRIHRHRGGE